jgi:uncharacterized protein with ParB-like and HNH nuclease domain
MSNLQINTRVRRLFNYLNDFEEGKIQIPPFQRDFVWTNEKKLELLESLKNGYPIGSVLFWQPNQDIKQNLIDEELQTVGGYYLKVKDDKIDFYYILDGYQRLSTLFGCFIDSKKTKLQKNDKEWKLKFDIVYNLKDDKFEFNRKTKTDLEVYQVPLSFFTDGEKFYDFSFSLMNLNFSESEKKEFINRYKNFGSKISSYDIPAIDLIGGTIKDAVDIFSRLNSRGEIISDYWKVAALSFNKERNFRFGSEVDALFEQLKKYNFFTAEEDKKTKRELILQCVLNTFEDDTFYFDSANTTQALEKLAGKEKFVDVSRKAFINIEKAVKFFHDELLVINSKLAPYNGQLIFITDFFNKIESPTPIQLESLKEWFWITTYANYFTIYNLSKQRLAYQSFREFLKDKNYNPIYYDNKEQTFETLTFPKKIEMGSVRAKALGLFMLQHQVKGEKLDMNLVQGYQTYKLFNEIEGNANISENTILVIEDGTYQIPKSQKDLSDWLISDADQRKFFIDTDMKIAFNNGASKESILAIRRKLIIEAEKSFVESFNLRYVE